MITPKAVLTIKNLLSAENVIKKIGSIDIVFCVLHRLFLTDTWIKRTESIITYVATYHSSAHFYQQINVAVLQRLPICITIQRQTNVHCQLQTKALEFTEARKNQQGLCLNKDHWFKHTWLVPVFSEPAWLACVCAQLKITILIYLYQRRGEKKNLTCKTWWRSHRSCRSGGNEQCSHKRS